MMKKIAGLFLLFWGCMIIIAVIYRLAVIDPSQPPDISNLKENCSDITDKVDSVFVQLKQLLEQKKTVPDDKILDLYKFSDEEIKFLSKEYGNTAINIVKEHGCSGAAVILSLGMQGVAIMRERPDSFEKICSRFRGETAAAFLIAYNNDFQQIATIGGLPNLLDRIEKLKPISKRIAEKHPKMFPFLLAAENEVLEAWEATDEEMCLACFIPLSLSQGGDGIREIAKMITQYGYKASQWVKVRGLDGILLADMFPSLLDLSFKNHHSPPVDLPVFLQIISENQDDLKYLLEQDNFTVEDVWRVIEKIKREDDNLALPPDNFDSLPENSPLRYRPYRNVLLELASTDSHTLRFILEKENTALDLIIQHWEQCGKFLPNLLYDAYGGASKDLTDQKRFNNAWESLTRSLSKEKEYCVLSMLFQMARFDGENYDEPVKSEKFYYLLGNLDYRVVLYLLENNTSKGYESLEERGFDELNNWKEPTSIVVEMIPGHDVCRFLWILSKGYTPRTDEAFFAALDVGFLAWDVVTLGGGHVSTVLAQRGTKAASKEIAKASAHTVLKKLDETAVRTAEKALLAKSFFSPRNIKKIAQSIKRTIGTNVMLATRSVEKHPKIILMTKNFATDWGIGITIGYGLQEGIKLIPAEKIEKANKTLSLGGDKIQEFMLYIHSNP
jgi:hypothetical protein